MKSSQPGPKKTLTPFLRAMLWTAIPIIVLNLIGTSVMWAREMAGELGGWFITAGLGLWGLAILACIGFAIARKSQIALGILAGIGIGFVGLMLSCFTTFATQMSGS